MATETISQQRLADSNPEELAHPIYSIFRYFFTEEIALQSTAQIIHDFLKALPISGYKIYSKLLALRLVYIYLKKYSGICLTQKTSSLGKEDALILLLRDQLHLSCKEIGAVIGIAEGSIRTRLERSRAKIFSTEFVKKGGPPLTLIRRSRHICIHARQMIEDTDPSQLIQNHEIVQCSKCNVIWQAKLESTYYFKKQNEFAEPQLMDKLKTIPLNSIFTQKGGRLKLNWAHLPLYFKIFFEGFFATALIAGILFFIPKIKKGYEYWLERRLDVYNIADLNITEENASPPENTTTTAADALPTQQTMVPLIKPETEFSGRDSNAFSQKKTYRILIKSDDPNISKTQVLEILKNNDYTVMESNHSAEKDLPSGVIFDIYIPEKNYNNAITDLSRLGETKIIITHSKNRSLKGKAHLLIWLQSI